MKTGPVMTAEQAQLNKEVIDVNWPGMSYFKAVCITGDGAWTDEAIGFFETEAAAIAVINQYVEVTNITAVVNVRVAPVPFFEKMIEED